MKKTLTKAVMALILISGLSVPAWGDGGWEAKLSVTAGRAENSLFFGQNAAASDGIDSLYDVPALLAGDVEASFLCDGSNLWRDIKGPGGEKVWDLRIESRLRGRTILIRWNRNALPGGVALLLRDETSGRTIDMGTRDAYRYKNTGPRNFTIETFGGNQ